MGMAWLLIDLVDGDELMDAFPNASLSDSLDDSLDDSLNDSLDDSLDGSLTPSIAASCNAMPAASGLFTTSYASQSGSHASHACSAPS